MQSYDLVVLGGGPGGYVAAIRAAQNGMRVALVEKDLLGGTCLNRGCIPTKALLHTAGLYRHLQQAERLGLMVEGVQLDWNAMHARKADIVTSQREGIAYLLQRNKVELLEGIGKVLGPGAVAVRTTDEETRLQTKNILVATGAKAACLPLPGFDLPGVYTSDDLLWGTPPLIDSLLIVGGGVIGVEFATLYQSLGCTVTIVEAAERLLPTLDKEIGQSLSVLLKKRGVSVATGATVTALEKSKSGLQCLYTQKGAEKQAEAEAVLVAVGRKPLLQKVFAEGLQPETQRGIVVDAAFQTSIAGVYAIGDVVEGSIQLAHAASAQGIFVADTLAGKKSETNLSVIPSCVYTEPEIACVGLTQEQAKAQGIEVKLGKFPMASLGKSVIEGQERGFIKLLFCATDDVLVGAQLMCGRATDLVGELALAIANGVTRTGLGSVIHPHPTFVEGVGEAVEDAGGQAVHMAPRLGGNV